MIREIKAFGVLPFSHKLVMVRAFLILPCLQISLRSLGLNRTRRILTALCRAPNPDPKDGLIRARRIANYTYVVNNRFPFLGECLARSLTIWFQLRRIGIESDLKFGMKKEQSELLAHAWIEYKGESLASINEQNEGYVFYNESILSESSE